MGQQTMGLSSWRWANNTKSILLLAAFPLLLLALLGGIFFVFGLVSFGTEGSDPRAFANMGLSFPGKTSVGAMDLAIAAMAEWWPAVAGVAAIWTIIGYAFNNALISAATGARAVERREEPRIYNLLENLCISRGLKMPQLRIVESEALNAYASGLEENSYTITVTRGLMERLNDAELEAVLGHELTHIMNRDVRLLVITVVFTGMISFIAQMLWRSLRLSSLRSSGGNGKRGGGAALFLMIAAIMTAIGYLLALLLRLALSRRREYLADAGSVELTKSPEAMISALEKISGHASMPDVPGEVRQMFIENPPLLAGVFGLFATHPPIEERIRVLRETCGLPTPGESIIPRAG